MKALLWICAALAIPGALDQAAGIRSLQDSPLPQDPPPISASSPLAALAAITNPTPGILEYPNAPGYPPDLAPDPSFMDLPDYAPSPGLDWADNVVDTAVYAMGLAPKGLPLSPDEDWVGAWQYVKENSTAPSAGPSTAPAAQPPERAAIAGAPPAGAISAFSLNG